MYMLCIEGRAPRFGNDLILLQTMARQIAKNNKCKCRIVRMHDCNNKSLQASPQGHCDGFIREKKYAILTKVKNGGMHIDKM